MDELEQSGYEEFDRLLAVVRRTRELLDHAIGDGGLPPGGADYLASETLPHVDGLRAGFQGSLRTDLAGIAELRYLLSLVPALRVQASLDDAERRAALAEGADDTMRARSTPVIVHLARPWDLAALSHARVVLALMPRLPDEAVRYPAGRRTYADIAAPRGPAELLERIEELERQLWRAASGDPPTPADQAFRRTYGFFDAADRLGWRALRPAA